MEYYSEVLYDFIIVKPLNQIIQFAFEHLFITNVIGHLSISGEEDALITLRSDGEERWSGIRFDGTGTSSLSW